MPSVWSRAVNRSAVCFYRAASPSYSTPLIAFLFTAASSPETVTRRIDLHAESRSVGADVVRVGPQAPVLTWKPQAFPGLPPGLEAHPGTSSQPRDHLAGPVLDHVHVQAARLRE
jgi:hypothetical protein